MWTCGGPEEGSTIGSPTVGGAGEVRSLERMTEVLLKYDNQSRKEKTI